MVDGGERRDVIGKYISSVDDVAAGLGELDFGSMRPPQKNDRDVIIR